MSRPERRRWASRGSLVALGLGLLGGVGVGAGAVLDPRQAAFSYLTAYSALVGIALGALALLMIGVVMRAEWILSARRPLGAIVGTLPLLALFFLPIVGWLDPLYPWVPPLEGLEPGAHERISAKRGYLNTPFFLVRSVVYLLVWAGLGTALRRWIPDPPGDSDAAAAHRARVLSAVGLPVLAFTLTFAAFDWLMSLSPVWFSTIYGLYFFAGGFAAALGLLALVSHLEARPGGRGGDAARRGAVAKMLLTFVLFWGYIAFSQVLTYWMGNIPVRVTWLVPRLAGGWGVLAGVVALGHLALPFLLLLPRALRTRSTALAAVGGLVLIMHYLDVYWLVMPELHASGPRPYWLDLIALLGVGGLATAYGLALFRARPQPSGDAVSGV